MAVVVAIALVAGGCSNGDDDGAATTSAAPGADRSAVFAELAEDVIVPAYEELAATTDELASAVAALCDAPDAAALDAARDAWDDAAGAWARTRSFRFGPVSTLRATGKISYELDADKLQEKFDTPGSIPEQPTPEFVDGLGADVRGLQSIEHLLFTPGDVTALDARSCQYAESAALLVSDAADEVATAWTEGTGSDAPFATQFAEPGEDSMFSDEADVLTTVLNAAIGTLAEVADMGLGPASGETTGTATPAEVDGRAARRALADLEDALTSVQLIYGSGHDADGSEPAGVGAIVATRSSDAAARAGDELAAAIGAVGSIPPPLAEVDPADPAQLQPVIDAYAAVADARVTFRTELASLLGVTVGFSDADGDA